MAHIQKKIYMAVSDEEYLKKMQEVVYTEQASDIFRLIYNYKREELEGIKEELPSLGSEESHMYCVCRDRMKKKSTRAKESNKETV